MNDESAEKPPAADVPSGNDPPSGTDVPPGDAPSAAATETVSEKPRKKKRRKSKAAEVPAEPLRDAIGPDGRERPAFLLEFPRDEALEPLIRAFELGNYAYVREHAPKLAESSGEQRVRDAALELSRRIEPDPLLKILLGLSIALLVVLTLWAYKTHGG